MKKILITLIIVITLIVTIVIIQKKQNRSKFQPVEIGEIKHTPIKLP